MTETSRHYQLFENINERFQDKVVVFDLNEVTLEVTTDDLIETCEILLKDPLFKFEELIDLCGVDYAAYKQQEWHTNEASWQGFSRGVSQSGNDMVTDGRFAVVYHLLSVSRNQRMRLRVYLSDDLIVNSVVDIWESANWFEREAYDLYGILFDGHPDLRRILTDYGFIGHPFRKDFPLSGHVEMRYDEEKKRVVYEPVQIEPRTLVPRVIRNDQRYPGNKE